MVTVPSRSGAGFEVLPVQYIFFGKSFFGIAFFVTSEVSRDRKDKHVRFREHRIGPEKDTQDCAIRRVSAFFIGNPFLEIRIGVRHVQSHILEEPEIFTHLVDDCHLVTVLKVLADSREIGNASQTELVQLVFRSDTGEH